VPEPILSDKQQGISIFDFIEGRKITSDELCEHHISQALTFFETLNLISDANHSSYPLYAAEACLSMKDHLNCVNNRMKNLLQIKTETDISQDAFRFIRDELLPLWEHVQRGICSRERDLFFNLDTPLSKRDLCISPSDFGFHNAIENDQGEVIFIDFEYAGLDDPVKMICDFFCQPQVQIPHSFIPTFANRVLEGLDHPDIHYARLHALLPVHTIKWCCIILNEFLPAIMERRLFANKDINIPEVQSTQLRKAEAMYERACLMIKW
jgi:hypothetical protein